MSLRAFGRSSGACLALALLASTVTAQPPVFTPFRDTGIYALGEPVGFMATAPPGAVAPPLSYHYTISRNNSEVIKTGTIYFDTVNFAPRIKAPTLAALGFIDTIAPPVGIWIALGQIPGAREAVPMVESDHNNITPEKQRAYEARSREVLDTLLKGGTFAPDERLTRK